MSRTWGLLGYLYGARVYNDEQGREVAYDALLRTNLYPSLYTGLSGCVDYAGLMMRADPRTHVYECAYCGNYWPQPFSSCGTCGGSMKLEPRYVR